MGLLYYGLIILWAYYIMGLLDHNLIVPSQTGITISHTTRHGWPRIHQLLLPPHVGRNQKMGGQGYINFCYHPT